VGRTLTVNGRPREIIGVAPGDFRFLRNDPAVILPAQLDPAEVFFGNFDYQAVARLRPGATLEQVAAEVDRLIPVAVERYPGPVSMTMVEQARFAAVIRPLKEDVVGDVRAVLWVLLAGVGMVLLIACANVANLFLVRAEGRVRDVAVRTALGATRGRVAVDFLSESLLLALAGGTLGVVLAFVGLEVLLAMAPGNLPRVDEISLDPVVLAFTVAVSLLAGLLFGLFALLRYGRPLLVSALKEGGRGGSAGRDRHLSRKGLVVAQVALALVLLVGSGLMIRSFQALRNVDPGFVDPDDVLVFRTTVPSAVVEDAVEAALVHEQILRRLRELPGVAAAGASYSVTMDGYDSNDALYVEDFPVPEGQIPPIRRFKWVMPGYFETMGNPLLAGRDISWQDIHDARPVAVVSENFAREHWRDPAAALGERIGTIVLEGEETVWREIVGVVGNVQDNGLDQPAPAVIYWPIVQRDWYVAGIAVQRSMAYAVRAGPDGVAGLLPRVQEAVWSVNGNLPLANVRTLAEILDRSLARTSFTLVMLGIAAGVALLLGTVGIYGVISYTVSQRSREIGVRMALGAGRGDVSRMVVGQGMLLTGLGVAGGLLAAFVLTRLMTSLLYGVEPLDPVTYLATASTLALVALVASWLPARRAASLDPAHTLRQE
jgi:predicted permease